ncbi:MAG: class I SAM-dependent methyltransferase family protein [Candidatus Lokiarchaeota archaeon]|nr:class I SAM-dependent methyltransferase family protein [Candidatus Lokiarchaeota archaeon]
MGFKDKLVEKLRVELTEGELELLPSGFQTLGGIIIIKLDEQLLEKKKLIANAYLDILHYMRSVYLNRGKIEGQFREPERIEYIAGKKDPVVEHKEHGVVYRFNIKKIMFSKGNINERKHLASLVKSGEVIVDMFAGIGYFSLPIAILADPKDIYSIELNPTAYKYLVENIQLNNVQEVVHPIHGNCKEEVLRLSEEGIKADRIIMGVFPAPKDYIEEALTLVKNSGTIIHYEGIADREKNLVLYNEFAEIAESQKFITELKDKRFVKSYGPNLYHIVYDIFAKKTEK